ncbi:uncharacterized protein (DUF427 family) [Salinibacter ruber]|uniref:DUF427 domain-containing protein n=1 Tax=Salinibacter ruber TaxID=146919 RepID=UPI002167C3BB|nr:DUF427 domain-containing protein [Salinibacter ruber]MCS3631645.1 uncharacterized protein (DUF427 family) [Salinibacter ruber]MCS3937999.1 uncharacterized protein (DUF427 family) [Salinibacter ruber]
MPTPTTPGPDQESVWDYPRPPALESEDRRIRVVFNEVTIADTTEALRVLETSHPPVYYLPPDDIATEHLEREQQTTMCEFKGRAVYYTLTVGDRSARSAAWGYPDPTARFAELQDYVTFYASKVDECYLGEEKARAQEGDFYGGWITDDVVGPFKGGPGTMGW